MGVRRDIAGTIALINGAPDWRDRLDQSADSVFRSFFAILLVIPFALLLERSVISAISQLPSAITLELPFVPIWIIMGAECISLLLVWLGGIGIIAALARKLNIGPAVSPLIIGFNWAHILVFVPVSFISVAMISLNQPFGVVMALMMGMVFRMFLRWRLFRETCQTSPSLTVALVAIVEIFGLAISLLFSGIFSLLAPLIYPPELHITIITR